MPTLTPEEARVLGVLVEKALTTPAQYPLSLNAVVTGCNQKNNRDPITDYDDELAQFILDSLRNKGCVREVFPTGGRVIKYKHTAREAFNIDTPQLVLLVELMLRGPQTAGELRGRAARMHDLGSLDQVNEILHALIAREDALVVQLDSGRAARFAQMIAPAAHPLDAVRAAPSGASNTDPGATTPRSAGAATRDALIERIESLEREVAELREAIAKLSGADMGAGSRA